MADNVQISEGVGKTVSTDDVAGVQYQRIKVDLGVDGAASPLVRGQQTAANSLPVTLPSDGTLPGVTGNIAHDSADSGNPVKTGTKAQATLSTATLVAAADRADSVGDLDGAEIVRENSTLADVVSGNASNTDGTSTSLIASSGSGVRTYITDVTISNTSASNIYVELKDGSTAMWTFPVPANGGVTHSFRTPLKGTAATAWNFDPSAAATTIYASASGFKSKVG